MVMESAIKSPDPTRLNYNPEDYTTTIKARRNESSLITIIEMFTESPLAMITTIYFYLIIS